MLFHQTENVEEINVLVGPKARAERSQCVEKAKHIGDRRLLAHTVVRPCPAIIGGEESCKTSSSAGPWCWPRPRHRGQRIPTVPSRIGPVEVDFVLVRHFLGRIFFSTMIQTSPIACPYRTCGQEYFLGRSIFSGRFYKRKWVTF